MSYPSCEFFCFLCTFRPKGTKMGISREKKFNEGWADTSFFFFETPTSHTQKILLRSRNIPPSTPGKIK